jgi:hypothetical protein
MRSRLRWLLSLVPGVRSQRAPAPTNAPDSRERADAGRRLEAARDRLKQTIPPPEEPAP